MTVHDPDVELVAAVFKHGSLDRFDMWAATVDEVVTWAAVPDPAAVGWGLAWRPDMTLDVFNRLCLFGLLTLPGWAPTSIPTGDLVGWMTEFDYPEDADVWHAAGMDAVTAGRWHTSGWGSPSELEWWQHHTGMVDPTPALHDTWLHNPWWCSTPDCVISMFDGAWSTPWRLRRAGMFDPQDCRAWTERMHRCRYDSVEHWWVTPETAAVCAHHGMTPSQVRDVCEQIDQRVGLPLGDLIPFPVIEAAAEDLEHRWLQIDGENVVSVADWWNAGVTEPVLIRMLAEVTNPQMWQAWHTADPNIPSRELQAWSVIAAGVARRGMHPYDLGSHHAGPLDSLYGCPLPAPWLVPVAQMLRTRHAGPKLRRYAETLDDVFS